MDPALFGALQRMLELYWGHKSFRPSQAEAIAATLSGRDVLCILPTGERCAAAVPAPANLPASTEG